MYSLDATLSSSDKPKPSYRQPLDPLPAEIKILHKPFHMAAKVIDTKYDTTYNINRRYSECQSGINY